MIRDPGDFDPVNVGVEAPPGHEGWRVGDEVFPTNPALDLPPEYQHITLLWAGCRDAMGGWRHLPAAGGLGDQSAWIIDAFGIIAREVRDEDARAHAIRRPGKAPRRG